MRLALSGDQSAYQRLLSCLAPHVRCVARRVLPFSGEAEIEDVVQETLLAVHLKRGTWNTSLPFLPWLNAVARHKAIDIVRRKGGRIEVEIDDFVVNLAVPVTANDARLDVDIVLAVLDPRDRAIVEQIYIEGHSAGTVAAKLCMKEGAVRVALHRALKQLSHKFNGRGS